MTNVTDIEITITLNNAFCLAKLTEHELSEPIDKDEIVHDTPHVGGAFIQRIENTTNINGESRLNIYLEMTPESDPYFLKYYQ